MDDWGSSNGIRVLCVEDEEDARQVAVDFLEALGYEVESAVNDQEGVDKALDWKPHFILMDVRMPLMSGPEAIRAIREHPDMVDVPIFVLSAYTDAKTVAQCEEAGATGSFAKPASFLQVDQTIKEQVNLLT